MNILMPFQFVCEQVFVFLFLFIQENTVQCLIEYEPFVLIFL